MKGCSKKKRRKKKSNFSKAAQRKNNKKYIKYQTGNDLSDRILTTMEFHKESFFVIRLHSTQSAVNLTVSYARTFFDQSNDTKQYLSQFKTLIL